MQEDKLYTKETVENLNMHVYFIDQEIKKIIDSLGKLKESVNSLKKDLDIVLSKSKENIKDYSSQNSAADTSQQVMHKPQTQSQIQAHSEKSVCAQGFDQNYILKDIRSKLKNLDDIIKKANEFPKKDEEFVENTTSQAIHNDKELNKIGSTLNNYVGELKQQAQELPKDLMTKEKLDTNSDVLTIENKGDMSTIGQIDELIKLEPGNFKHYIKRADIYIKKNDYIKAKLDYKKAQDITQSKNISVLLSLAGLYIVINNFKKALELYNQVLKVDPSNIDALQQRATCYLNFNKEAEFLEDITKAISLDENNAKSYAIRAEYNASKKLYLKALNDGNMVVTLLPDNVNAKYFRAVMLYNLEEYNECFYDIEPLLESNNIEDEAYKYIGICSFKLDKIEEAMMYLAKAIEIGIKDYRVFYYKALAEYKNKNFDVSLEDVSKAIDMNPKEYKCYLLRARIFNEKDLFDKAHKDYEKTYKLKLTLDILIEKAEFLMKCKKYKQALADYTLVIKLDPTKASFYKQRSYIYERLGKDNKAKEDLQKALSINSSGVPNISIKHSQFFEESKVTASSQQYIASDVLIKKELHQRSSEAKVISEDASAVKPSSVQSLNISADVLFNRANINYKNKKFDNALKDIENVILQDPYYAKIYTLKAAIYHQLQDVEKELQSLNKLIEFNHNLFLPYVKRAEIYVLQNKENLAFSDFSKALELNSKNAATYIGLARIYAKRGQKDKALESYNNAKEYDVRSVKTIDQEIRVLY